MRETGPRGVYLVHLEQDRPPSLTFVPTASVVWERITVDVADCSNLPQLVQKVMRELFAVNGDAACEEMVTRLTLTGATALHEVLQRPGVLEDVRRTLNESYTEFFCDALIDETCPLIDEEALRAENLFPSVFLRAADAVQADRDDEIAYLQEEFLARNVSLSTPFSPKQVDKLAAEAEALVLDLLLQGDDA